MTTVTRSHATERAEGVAAVRGILVGVMLGVPCWVGIAVGVVHLIG